jgi:hypothetical protein
MFLGSGYRATILNQFFRDNLSDTFTYVYTYKSYIDNMFDKNSAVLLKTFALFFNNSSPADIVKFNIIIAEFKKLAVDKLKMARKKNAPDYCYYVNSAVRWGISGELNHVIPSGVFEILGIVESTNACTLAMCLEVHRLIAILSYYSIIK